MNKKAVLAILCVGFFMLLGFQDNLVAATTNQKFGEAAIQTKTEEIKSFVFGAPMILASVLAAVFSIFMAYAKSSFVPVLTVGGIILIATIMPQFISGVFNASGMLLP
jgi:hypothetical protein